MCVGIVPAAAGTLAAAALGAPGRAVAVAGLKFVLSFTHRHIRCTIWDRPGFVVSGVGFAAWGLGACFCCSRYTCEGKWSRVYTDFDQTGCYDGLVLSLVLYRAVTWLQLGSAVAVVGLRGLDIRFTVSDQPVFFVSGLEFVV